jgi:predicted NUDIX family NTP pyrophosphohydrolase
MQTTTNMAQLTSAGLLMCQWSDEALQFFLVHPGGPFFKNKDDGVWSIPKGLPEGDEDLLVTAQREFFEETGIQPAPPFYQLSTVKQKGGKIVHAWTFLGQWDQTTGIVSNTFKLEWPPRSGKFIDVPEQDKAEWMPAALAKKRINPAQAILIDEAQQIFENLKVTK